jgi:hypothetical protein
MGDQVRGGTDTASSTLAWLRRHVVDIVVLVLGTILTLRFWFVVFGVQDRTFMTILALLSLCEVVKRVIMARRRSERPQLFCADLRFDLISAIAIGTTPWPITITLPLNAASPLWSFTSAFALAAWVRPLTAGLVVSVAAYRLVSSRA